MVIDIVETNGVKYLKPINGDYVWEFCRMLEDSFGFFDSQGDRNFSLENHNGYETAIQLHKE